MEEEAAIIVGRTVKDYAACGVRVPSAAKIVACKCCNTPVALGSAGQHMLATAKVSYVLCRPCAELIASTGPLPISRTVISTDAREQMERVSGMADRVAQLEGKFKKGK